MIQVRKVTTNCAIILLHGACMHMIPVTHCYGCHVQGYGSHLVGSSLQLLEAAAAALDGERDPRCLLADFSIIQSLAELYAVTGEISGKVCTQVCPLKNAPLCIGLSEHQYLGPTHHLHHQQLPKQNFCFEAEDKCVNFDSK